MVNYPKTEQAFQAVNYKYEKHASHIEEDRWYAKVMNPTTGNYNQYADLAAEYRTDDTKANKVYPLVRVFQLIRVKTSDNKEWIKSRQMWTGLDKLGNEVEITFTDPEIWEKPIFQYEMKPKDPRNPNGART